MKIKVEPFLMKKGNRVAKAAIEFDENDSFLSGFHLVGFTICEDTDKGLFVLFPASVINGAAKDKENKPFFFLRPKDEEQIARLEDLIIDKYDDMISINKPIMR